MLGVLYYQYYQCRAGVRVRPIGGGVEGHVDLNVFLFEAAV